MILMLLIGWTILLPALVVAGLYLTSSVLGRRQQGIAPLDIISWSPETEDRDDITASLEPRERVEEPTTAERAGASV